MAKRLWLDLDSAVEFTGATAEEIASAAKAGDLRVRRVPKYAPKFDAADLVVKWPAAGEALLTACGKGAPATSGK